MCVKFTTKIRQTKRRRFAYKEVRHPELVYPLFFSRWVPQKRLIQTGYENKGYTITYKMGEVAKSDMDVTPGIFMYSRRCPFHRNASVSLLRMEIPVGTRYRLGKEDTTQRTVICAEKAIPVKEV